MKYTTKEWIIERIRSCKNRINQLASTPSGVKSRECHGVEQELNTLIRILMMEEK
jgi:hypothetical protein